MRNRRAYRHAKQLFYFLRIVDSAVENFSDVCTYDAKHEPKHGANLSCCPFDEIHVQRTRDLFAVLAIPMGTRRQPLVICMTTAG